MGVEGTWHVYGRELRVTNLDKVLFPAIAGEEGVTKREFLRYAAQIAPILLPYLTGRAFSRWQPLPERCPDKGLRAQGAAQSRTVLGAPLGQL